MTNQWDDTACLGRYQALVESRPELFENPERGGYRILSDRRQIEEAKRAALARRQRENLPSEDLRVGVLADDPYVLVMREAVRFPDGTLGLYNRFFVPVSIVVLPILQGRIVLMHRYRHGTRAWHYEVPRGIIDAGENIQDAARRELSEEIGGETLELIPLGSLHASSGITNEFGHLFVAHLASIGRPDQHEAVARIELVDQQSFRSMIAAGDISDGPTLAAYAQAQARGLLA